MQDLFAPPTAIELKQVNAAPDLFAPPTAQELGQTQTNMFAPPSPEELETTKPNPGLIWSDITTDAELRQIAQKHGVNPADLQEVASYFGATKQNETPLDLLKNAAGFVGESAGVNIPQKLYKMTQDAAHEAALDELSELANKKKSYLREAADIAMPVAGAGSLGKLAGIGIGAAAGFGGSKAGEEISSSGLGGALGGALGAAIPLTGRAIEKLGGLIPEAANKAGPEIEKKIEHKLLEGGQDLINLEQDALKRGYVDKPIQLARRLGIHEESPAYQMAADEIERAAGHASPQEVLEKVADNHISNLKDDIVKEVGAENWEQAVKEHGGIDHLISEVHPELKKREFGKQVAREENLRPERKIGRLEGIALKLTDDKPLMKIFDRRLGTSLEQTIDQASENIAKSSVYIKQDLNLLNDFMTKAKSLGVTAENFDPLYSTGRLPADLKQEWNKLTGELLSRVNSRGAGIEAKADYIRHQVIKPDDLPNALRTMIKAVDEKTGAGVETLTQDQFRDLATTNPLFHELHRGVELLAGTPITNARDFTNKLADLIHHDTAEGRGASFYSRISAAREKLGTIPEFLREPNQFKAMQDYIVNINNSLATRPIIIKLKTAASHAEALGDTFAANHIHDKISDLLGGRQDTIAAALSEAERKFKSYVTGRGYPSLAKIPDYMKAMSSNMYANLLGGSNMFASMQNLATPALSAIPDIGMKTGTASWLNSLGKIAQLKKNIGEDKLEDFLAKKGLLKTQISPELARSLGQTGAVGAGVRKFNQYWLTLFEKSEQLARAQVYFMGQDLGSKIASNPEWGAQFINKLNSPSYRRSMGTALQTGNVVELQNQMTRYLNSNHLLNYDKAAQSAYGRYVGSALSAFTKWPTTMWGKVVQELYDKGATRGSMEVTRKILAPMAALGVVDTALRDQDTKHRKLSSLSPGEALTNIRVTPVPGKVAGDIVSAIKEADAHKLRRAVLTGASMYIPVVGAVLKTGLDINKQLDE